MAMHRELTPEEWTEIQLAACDRSPYTVSSWHVSYDDEENRWQADALEELRVAPVKAAIVAQLHELHAWGEYESELEAEAALHAIAVLGWTLTPPDTTSVATARDEIGDE